MPSADYAHMEAAEATEPSNDESVSGDVLPRGIERVENDNSDNLTAKPANEGTNKDAFDIYSYYISLTDHLPSDIRRSLNLIAKLSDNYTGPANDLETLFACIEQDDSTDMASIISKLSAVNTGIILRDRKESISEATRLLQVASTLQCFYFYLTKQLYRHYKKLDSEITKMEKASQLLAASSTEAKDGLAEGARESVNNQSSQTKKGLPNTKEHNGRQSAPDGPVSNGNKRSSQREMTPGRTLRSSPAHVRGPVLETAHRQTPSRASTRLRDLGRIVDEKSDNVLRSSSVNNSSIPKIKVVEKVSIPNPERESSAHRRELRNRGTSIDVLESSQRSAPNERGRGELPLNGKQSSRKVMIPAPDSNTTGDAVVSRALRNRATPAPASAARETRLQKQLETSVPTAGNPSRNLRRPSSGPETSSSLKIISTASQKKQSDSREPMDTKESERTKKRKVEEKTYCICNDVSYGNMIACDDKSCKIEWYHLRCVNLKRPPNGEWICQACVERRKKRRR